MITGFSLNKSPGIFHQLLLLLLNADELIQLNRIQTGNGFKFLAVRTPNGSMYLMPIQIIHLLSSCGRTKHYDVIWVGFASTA
jgi:hypothetical protein